MPYPARVSESAKHPRLTRELIAATALALIDREGPSGASIRRVAARLDVHPTSLYNHVPSLAAMIEDVRAIVSARIDATPFDALPWPEALDAWAWSYRGAFAKHPRTIPVLMSVSATSPVLLAEHERFAVAAVRAGWADHEVLPLLTAFESFILGSVLDMSGPTVLFDPRGQEADFPAFSDAYRAAVAVDADDPVATRAFTLGLRMLVAGAARPIPPRA